MTASQHWDPDRYARNARFVAELGGPVVELLSPASGERILDLGCGDGALTEKLMRAGCSVVGVDSSAEQIEAARRRGIDARVADAERLSFQDEFDAVFSNAALHWMKQADEVIAGVRRALKPGGRFVAECGGDGCVRTIIAALYAAVADRGLDGAALNPWYFPTVDDYRGRLERAGFQVRSILLVPRPTPLPTDIIGWLETFAGCFISALPLSDRSTFLADVRDRLKSQLCAPDGSWTADYVRLRFAATKPA